MEDIGKQVRIIVAVLIGFGVFNSKIVGVDGLQIQVQDVNGKVYFKDRNQNQNRQEDPDLIGDLDRDLPYEDKDMTDHYARENFHPDGDNGNGKNRENDPFNPDTAHVPGGLPMMSDSAFSLIILIYVSVAFLVVFFLFCWKSSNGNGNNGSNGKLECPLMTADTLAAVKEPHIIPPTPTMEHEMLAVVIEEKDTSV